MLGESDVNEVKYKKLIQYIENFVEPYNLLWEIFSESIEIKFLTIYLLNSSIKRSLRMFKLKSYGMQTNWSSIFFLCKTSRKQNRCLIVF
jgi:hypothetical protein